MRRFLFALFTVLLFAAGCSNAPRQEAPPPTQTAEGVVCRVAHVVDGDTLIVNYKGGQAKVRLIGIDTPESVHRDETKNTREGKIASERLSKYLTGQEVRLEFDEEAKDKYGRWLAYVYRGENMVNKEILMAGLARTLTIPPNTKHADEFKEIESEARESGAGFWGRESDLFVRKS